MTRQEFTLLVKAMKAVYALPTFIPDKDAFDVWYELIKDLPFNLANAALKHYMQTSPKLPTPADIRASAARLAEPEELSEFEAWSLVSNAISRSGYYAEEEFSKLPEAVKQAVGSAGQLRAWSQSDISSIETVAQSNFMRAYRTVLTRTREHKKMSPDILALIDSVTKRLEQKNEP